MKFKVCQFADISAAELTTHDMRLMSLDSNVPWLLARESGDNAYVQAWGVMWYVPFSTYSSDVIAGMLPRIGYSAIVSRIFYELAEQKIDYVFFRDASMGYPIDHSS